MPNKEFLEKAKACASKEELLNASKEAGYKFTEEEITNFFNQFHAPSGALSDEELDNVTGGSCYSSEDIFGNGRHHLITTVGNSCDGYQYRNGGGADWGSCGCDCSHFFYWKRSNYCDLRYEEYDPYA